MAVLGALAEGITTVTDAAELRAKESDRIASTVEMIRALGGGAEPTEDGFAVVGTGFLEPGRSTAPHDHRIAMAAGVAAIGVDGSVGIQRRNDRRRVVARVLRAGGGAVVIAIDGPAVSARARSPGGSPKSSGFRISTPGATYRAATLAVLRAGVDPADADAVLDDGAGSDIDYDDGVVTSTASPWRARVRSAAVTAAVSRRCRRIRTVRDRRREMQRRWVPSRGGRAVVEGRDIGTVVFPDAPGQGVPHRGSRRAGRPAVRRRRGWRAASVGDIAADLERRDRHDSTRDGVAAAACRRRSRPRHLGPRRRRRGRRRACRSSRPREQAEQYGG